MGTIHYLLAKGGLGDSYIIHKNIIHEVPLLSSLNTEYLIQILGSIYPSYLYTLFSEN